MNDAQPPKKKQKWIPIVLGILFLFVVLAIGGVVFVVSFHASERGHREHERDVGRRRFAKERERFAGRKPLIEMVDGRPQYLGDRPPERHRRRRSSRCM